jgi:glycosyltransferase involved in cell wall biosynthesis
MPRRRVLMIAHYFPPAGGSGSNRALAFARYLPEYGWEPIVITPTAAWASNRDDELLTHIPPGVHVIRTRSLEQRPSRGDPPLTRSFLAAAPRQGPSDAPHPSALRSNVGHLKRFPDAHLGWLPFALAAARRQDYDVAYSSSGPFTSHLVGLILKRFTRKPWVAELRDGWYCWNRAIFPDYPAWRAVLERSLEAAALRAADRVVLVTDRMADAFRAQYPDLPREKFAVVSNGFDPAQFTNAAHAPHPNAWQILHGGALYYGRSLAAFLDAARRLIEEDADFASQFRLTLLGTLDPRAQAEIARSGLQAHVHVQSQVSHAQALAAMTSADALLLVANTTPGAEATVPGKLFEYLATGRPLLAVAPSDSSTADILAQTGGGWLAEAGDAAAIAGVLRQAFSAHRAGHARNPKPDVVARFDRRVLAGDLAHLFDQAVSDGAAGRA